MSGFFLAKVEPRGLKKKPIEASHKLGRKDRVNVDSFEDRDIADLEGRPASAHGNMQEGMDVTYPLRRIGRSHPAGNRSSHPNSSSSLISHTL